jgi:hypothetical protein
MKRFLLDIGAAADRWGGTEVSSVFPMAAAALRKRVAADSKEAKALVDKTESWKFGPSQVPVASVLRQIAEVSRHHCRRCSHEARVVLQPYEPLDLLSFLDAGRLLFVILGGDDRVQAWAVVDMQPCRASEPQVRAVAELVQHCPIFSDGWGGGQLTGHSELHFQGSGEAPVPAAIVQVYRVPLDEGSPEAAAEHDQKLAGALFSFIRDELSRRGVSFLVGYRLVAVDGTSIEDLMQQRGLVSKHWSFYDGRALAFPVRFTFDWSPEEGVVHPARMVMGPAPGVKRSRLAHTMEIIEMRGIRFMMEPSVHPYLVKD